MNAYKIKFHGYAVVQADSPEEAEDLFFGDGLVEFEQYEVDEVEEMI